jgi:hypothetical protein
LLTGALRDLGIAIAAGIAAALLSYVFGRIVLRPRLKCPSKLRLRDYGDGPVAQLKLFNASPVRSITTVQIAAYVLVPFSDSSESSGHEINSVRVPVSLTASESLRLSPRQERVVSMSVDDVPEFTRTRLKAIGVNLDATRLVTDFLELDQVKPKDKTPQSRPRPKLMVTVNCKDSVTGRDFSFLLPPIYRTDLCTGIFTGSDDSEYGKLARGVARHVTRTRRFVQRHQATGFKPDQDQLRADTELAATVTNAMNRARSDRQPAHEAVMKACNVDENNARKLITTVRRRNHDGTDPDRE